MDTPILGLKASVARKAFKRRAGQNNHFLITVLVGLDAVRKGSAGLPEEFSTSWNPHDIGRSYDRSREYALTTSLAWIVDLLDAYRSRLCRTPSLLAGSQIAAIDKLEGRSAKLREAAKVLGAPETPDELLVHLGIHWRNQIVHSDSRTKLDGRIAAELVRHRADLLAQHNGLEISSTLDRITHGDAPTFKEVASIIAASQRTVQHLDAAALSRLDLESYSETVIRDHLRSGIESGRANTIAQMWPGAPDKTMSRLTQVLLQGRMTQVPREDNHVSPQHLVDLASMSASAARQRFIPS